ncbi:MAG: hypothetical protein IJ710_06725 [Prevotella sp.]|nr:hypothetical protein [Prevotella sp.]
MIDLQSYMGGTIRNIMIKAYKNVLTNPREAKFAFKMQQSLPNQRSAASDCSTPRELTSPRFS